MGGQNFCSAKLDHLRPISLVTISCFDGLRGAVACTAERLVAARLQANETGNTVTVSGPKVPLRSASFYSTAVMGNHRQMHHVCYAYVQVGQHSFQSTPSALKQLGCEPRPQSLRGSLASIRVLQMAAAGPVFQADIGLGRLIRVRTHRGDPDAAIYVVAEPEVDKAIQILRAARGQPHDEYEDLGRVSDAVLNALSLQPGMFART